MLARRGAQFVPTGTPTICWKTFPAKLRKWCLPETKASWWCHLQGTCFLNQSVPSQNMLVHDLIPNILSAVTVLKMKGFCLIPLSLLFQFLVRNGCTKDRKSKNFMFFMVKFGDILITSLNSWGPTFDRLHFFIKLFRSTSEGLA